MHVNIFLQNVIYGVKYFLLFLCCFKNISLMYFKLGGPGYSMDDPSKIQRQKIIL